MAVEETLVCETYTSGADLSAAANQYKLVKITAANTIDVCSGTTDTPIGVLQNKPKSGQAATIAVRGVSKCQAGSAITAGLYIGTTSTGLAQTAATGQHVIGIAKTAVTNSGELFSLSIDRGQLAA